MPALAQAQVPDQAVELYGTAALVGGLTPVSVSGRTRLTPHGGARLDGAIQGEQYAFGLGVRYWEAARTGGVGTLGLDLFAQGEWRRQRDSRTSVRVTTGFGFESVDGGATSVSGTGQGDGILTWSVGVARELVVPNLGVALLSADLVVPPVTGDPDGRRRPVIELGVGYRWREYQRIRMPASRGAR